MSVSIEALREDLQGKRLPGGRIVIEPHEAFIGDQALRATPDADGAAHPAWFVIASLRCMGISVEQLCELAHQHDGDTLLFGNCRVEQFAPLQVGAAYSATAQIEAVDSRTTRDGSRLDSIEVVVRLSDATTTTQAGEIASTYLFKRGNSR